jgi:hypothetical protein
MPVQFPGFIAGPRIGRPCARKRSSFLPLTFTQSWRAPKCHWLNATALPSGVMTMPTIATEHATCDHLALNSDLVGLANSKRGGFQQYEVGAGSGMNSTSRLIRIIPHKDLARRGKRGVLSTIAMTKRSRTARANGGSGTWAARGDWHSSVRATRG